MDKFCSPWFCAILSSHKNVSNNLCLIMKILTEKNLDIIHFLLRQQPYSIWTITQDLIKLGAYNMSYSSLFKVSTKTQDETGCQCGRKQLKPGKIQIFFFPNIFKIKDKILINFSVASHTASWSHQNIKIRIKEQ